jgi:hypothetical protein
MATSLYIMWSTVQYRHWDGNILLHNVKHGTIQTLGWQHLVTQCEAQYITDMGMATSCYIMWSMVQYRHWDGTILLHSVKHSTIQTCGWQHLVTQCEAQYITDMGMATSCYIVWSTVQYRHVDGNILLHNVKHNTLQTRGWQHLVTQCEAQYITDMRMAPSCYIMWSTLQYRHGYGTILLHSVKHNTIQIWVWNHLVKQW